MRVRAFAKINLSLRVLDLRPDGYHELRTIFQSIALHDTLTIRRARGAFALRCDDPSCPVGPSNLVWRAAAQVWAASGRRGAPRDVQIALTKRIPMQAGLGGGSSDAAAAIRALGRLWRVDEARQRDIGRSLGADIPYFFEGGTVLGLDRGDSLYALLDPPSSWVVIGLPSFGVSTAEAFGWFDGGDDAVRDRAAGANPSRGAGQRSPRPGSVRPVRDHGQFGNDLEPFVGERHPEIAAYVHTLRDAGASHAAMSGSGSAVFGLFANRGRSAAAAKALGRVAARVLVTRTINRQAYQRLACK